VYAQRSAAPLWLSPTHHLALWRAVRKSGQRRDIAVIRTLLGTGVRAEELIRLEVSDLTLQERKGWLHIPYGKDGKERDIPFGKETVTALKHYLAVRESAGRAALLIGHRGPLTYRGIVYIVSQHARRAKLEHCTPHTLRHGYGKNLAAAGTPLEHIAALMRHSHLESTLIYTRPSQADLEKAVLAAEATRWRGD
jgi:site-specific recombinase XerD